jgi:uncharacterized protein YbjT (DUF2867 family)
MSLDSGRGRERYLVVGATGPVGLGGEICRLLRSAGKATRAIVRATSDTGRVDTLRTLGVELTEGDLKDRRSLEVACQGVTTVISTASMLVSRQPSDTVEEVDSRGQNNLVDVARNCGVESFVYTSISGHIDREFPFRNAKRDVEHHLKTSGLSYTILRPTFYMEVWLTPIAGFDFPNAHAAIYGEGLNKISWLSFYDVARFAVWCIDDPKARNAMFELGGPEALSPREVVRIFEDISGRLFEIEFVPESALFEEQTAGEDSRLQSLAGLRLCYADGDMVDNNELMQRLPPPTTVRDYATVVLTPTQPPI